MQIKTKDIEIESININDNTQKQEKLFDIFFFNIKLKLENNDEIYVI